MNAYLPWIVITLLAVCLFVGVGVWLSAQWQQWVIRRRERIADKGEVDAVRLLKRAGYKIVGQQVARRWSLDLDGESVSFEVRADLLVEKKGKILVAEVKTGGRAPDPLYPATRRQLLEYLLVFGGDRILLVDMDARRIHEVVFPDLELDDVEI